MMRAMCEVKMIEKKRSQELISFLGLKNTLDGPARASGVQWYGQDLRKAIDFVSTRRGKGS